MQTEATAYHIAASSHLVSSKFHNDKDVCAEPGSANVVEVVQISPDMAKAPIETTFDSYSNLYSHLASEKDSEWSMKIL
jgi:hypothetical protein